MSLHRNSVFPPEKAIRRFCASVRHLGCGLSYSARLGCPHDREGQIVTNSEFRDPCHKPRARKLSLRYVAGVTLIELMVGVALIAILAALAVPSFNDFRERASLRGAVEQFSSRLAEVRNESVKENAIKTVDFTTIALPNDVTRSALSMTSDDGDGTVRVNPRDGMLTADSQAGNVVLSIGNYQLQFSVTPLGRSTVCAPSGHSVPGYKDC